MHLALILFWNVTTNKNLLLCNREICISQDPKTLDHPESYIERTCGAPTFDLKRKQQTGCQL